MELKNLSLVVVLIAFCFSSCKSTMKPTTGTFNNYPKTILEYGAKLDGKTDDSGAVQASLNANNYAYIPYSKSGMYIATPIVVKGDQAIWSDSRAMKIYSGVKKDEYCFYFNDISFGSSAEFKSFTIVADKPSLGAIYITRSRNVTLKDFSIRGHNKFESGVVIDGGKTKGSAWNYMDNYCISRCDKGIYITSQTPKPFSNRNYIGYGVVQSCKYGVVLDRAATNTLLVNPQGCEVSFHLKKNANSNRIQTYEEGAKKNSIIIEPQARNNIIIGGIGVSTLSDKGVKSRFELSEPKMKKLKKTKKNE